MTARARADPLTSAIEQGVPLLVLSPHLDDAALSCGAMLIHACDRTQLTVATFFTEAPPPPYTLSARRYLRQVGAPDAQTLYGQRRSEDRAALEPLGITCLHMGLTEAQFRLRPHRGAHSRWARWPSLFPSRPVVHTVPGVMEPHLLSRSRPLGTTVAYSEVTARALRAAGFGDVRVIAPAVSQAQWPRLPRPAGIPAVLFAGHHDPGGGAVEAIAAAGVARQAGARFRLVLAMRLRPGQRGRALAADLVRLAGREGLHDVTVHGYVADMPGLLAATDVLLFIPRRLSGKADIPLTVLEALATSRPVIISDLPQVAGLGDAVLRAPAGDAQQAGLLLAGLLAEPRWWEAMAERGNAMVRARFGSQRCVAQYRRLYSELLG
jgi:glycosyltransferase involved in cell wall biosynthesis